MHIRVAFLVTSGQWTYYIYWGKKTSVEINLRSWLPPELQVRANFQSVLNAYRLIVISKTNNLPCFSFSFRWRIKLFNPPFRHSGVLEEGEQEPDFLSQKPKKGDGKHKHCNCWKWQTDKKYGTSGQWTVHIILLTTMRLLTPITQPKWFYDQQGLEKCSSLSADTTSKLKTQGFYGCWS